MLGQPYNPKLMRIGSLLRRNALSQRLSEGTQPPRHDRSWDADSPLRQVEGRKELGERGLVIRSILSLAVTIALAAPPAAAEAQAADMPSEIRLSDTEKEKVLEEAAANNRLRPSESEEKSRPSIHGELGFAIGTDGYRSVYGTAVVPLEGEGVAVISLDSTDFGSRKRIFDPWWQ